MLGIAFSWADADSGRQRRAKDIDSAFADAAHEADTSMRLGVRTPGRKDLELELPQRTAGTQPSPSSYTLQA
jgi:hypothetical protein